MRLPCILLFPLCFAACATAAPTPAVVSRYEPVAGGLVFRTCVVNTSWSLAELLANCGPPEAFLRNGRIAGGLCAIYKTEAQPFWAERGAPALAVCLAPHPKGNAPLPPEVAVAGFSRAQLQALRVSTVDGLRSLPPLPSARPADSTPIEASKLSAAASLRALVGEDLPAAQAARRSAHCLAQSELRRPKRLHQPPLAPTRQHRRQQKTLLSRPIR